jgi:putative hemolysin
MVSLLIIQLSVLLALLALSAFFSSSETACFNLDPLRLRRMEKINPAATRRVQAILSEPTRLLYTILIGNTVVNVAASSLGFNVAERLVPGRGEVVSVPIMTLLLLIFGEVGPKRVALFWTDRVVVLYARPLEFIVRLLRPVQWVMDRSMRRYEHLFQRRGRTLTDEELESVVELSERDGLIDVDESKMVRSIIGLEDLKAGDVMTPRVDVTGIDLNEPDQDTRAIAIRTRVRYLPLFRDNLDHIEGFLDVHAFLLDPDHRMEAARVPPWYVPVSSPLDKLLAEFQQKHMRVAVVVDEYGGTAGLITRGDIIEEITGEIDDEFGVHRSLLEDLGARRWLADGNISLEELNERCGLALVAEGSDRLAGWIAAIAGRLPRVGEAFESQGCRATVKQMRRTRITLVQLEHIEASR